MVVVVVSELIEEEDDVPVIFWACAVAFVNVHPFTSQYFLKRVGDDSITA